ncbi:GNAT family N-acetyltransferase [Curtobacterium sp. ISL-83]|uniref:GNAT family N-acetyltransferase n=1 Tax=Curtobacterium sp. ISL-83 TaxID=2819145 RepID=UPI001BE58ED6|nr:GNAT family N-acetyltransferase [Curtobacterium sp. ISL-83]MBT2503877.1 GNAT family N-acetyltransferase [Curtobacterium sp. ISL-83]
MIDSLPLPVPIATRDATLLVRRASPDDLHAIIALLADDPISAARGDIANDDDVDAYATALDRITDAPGNELLVVVDDTGTVVGTLQLTLIPGMARRGATRLLVEAVRVTSAQRSSGIGSAVMRWVVDQGAIELQAALVQLTSDAARVDAHRFYRKLGFVDSHLGFKFAVALPDPQIREQGDHRLVDRR